MAQTSFAPRKAERRRRKLRLSLTSTTGVGKTFTALTLATALVEGTGKRILLIDTEGGSSEIYGDKFDFDVIVLTEFLPYNYVNAIKYAVEHDYGVVIPDSLSHAWMGKGGCLEQVDAKANTGGNRGSSFNAWADVTPQHNALIDAVLNCPIHLICTMRQKAEYVVESKNGKSVPRKVGMAPVQREGMEYEFDICADLVDAGKDQPPTMVVTKSRMSELRGQSIKEPNAKLGKSIRKWLEEGTDTVPATTTPPPPRPTPEATAAHQRHAEGARTNGQDTGRSQIPPRRDPPQGTPVKQLVWDQLAQWTGISKRQLADLADAGKKVYRHLMISTDKNGATDDQLREVIAFIAKAQEAGVEWMEWQRDPDRISARHGLLKQPEQTADVGYEPIQEEDIPF